VAALPRPDREQSGRVSKVVMRASRVYHALRELKAERQAGHREELNKS